MPKTKINNIDWHDAFEVLHNFVPTCDSFSPEEIAKVATAMGCKVNWEKYPCNWESESDLAILERILPDDIPAESELICVAESSYTKLMPFVLFRGDVETFVDEHRIRFGECVVNGDLVAIVPSIRSIVLFHHEGYFATIRFPQGQSAEDSFLG